MFPDLANEIGKKIVRGLLSRSAAPGVQSSGIKHFENLAPDIYDSSKNVALVKTPTATSDQLTGEPPT